MRQFSPSLQFAWSMAIGAGTAIGSCLVYKVIDPQWLAENGDVRLGLLIVGPLTVIFGGAIVSGLLLRMFADRASASVKSFLATPVLYVVSFFFVSDLIRGFTHSLAPFLVVLVFPTWLMTYLSFRIGRRGSDLDPNAPPTCHKCGYNLTGNVSGICPECGSAVARTQ